MKNILLAILFTFIGLQSFAFTVLDQLIVSNTDSLVIKKKKSTKEFIIPSGGKVKIWKIDNSKIKGTFQQIIDNNTIAVLDKEGSMHTVLISDILRIRHISKKGKKILGITLVSLGSSLIVMSVPIFFAAVLASGLSGGGSELGLIVGVSLITVASGIVINKIGWKLIGKKKSLTKDSRWYIATDHLSQTTITKPILY